MTSFSSNFRRPALLAACALCSALAAMQPAVARERQTAASGPQGKTVQRDTSREQGDVSSTTTGANGRVWQRKVDRSKAGTTATATGPNGQTATRNTTVTKSGTAASAAP